MLSIEKTMQMQRAYRRFLESRFDEEYPIWLIIVGSTDDVVIDCLLENYESEYYPDYERKESHEADPIDDMFNFLEHVDDIDMGGVSENFSALIDDYEKKTRA